MKNLDLDKLKVYTTENTVESRKYIGQEGYFSNSDDFKIYFKLKLFGISPITGTTHPYFGMGKRNKMSYGYKYFIPCESAEFKEEKKKEFRPFKDLREFTEVTGCGLGDIIVIQRKDGRFEEACLISGYKTFPIVGSPSMYISLGVEKYSFSELLQFFKYLKNGEWHWFGVEE